MSTATTEATRRREPRDPTRPSWSEWIGIFKRAGKQFVDDDCTGLSQQVAFGALHGLFPVALFTIGALKNTNPVLIKTARVLRLAPLATARTVLLPAALPEIVTGLRIGFSATLLGTLIGELFASDQGLGFMLIRAMEAHKVLDIMALTLLLFAFAAAVNMLLLAVERRMHRR